MNVVLMISDDWSPLAKCYGDTVVQTPHIDRLAAKGTVFHNAFCTTPTCAASRANLLTGMYSHQHRQYGHSHGPHHFRTREDVTALPAVLSKSGMKSGLCGKSHIAPHEIYGFTSWQETPGLALFSNRAVQQRAEKCLQSFGDTPFYLHCASGYPHRTGGNYDRNTYGEELAADDVLYQPAEVLVPAYLPDTPEVRQDIAEYYTFITRFDRFVGDTIQAVEDAGKLDETMFILLSDHGMPFPGAKASPFEAGHHCPLIITHPDGLGAGQHCDALVNWCDIMPTVLESMGVPRSEWPSGLTGSSLLPLLKNPEAEWRDLTFYSHSFHEVTNYFPYRIARGKRYKYVRCLAPQLPLPLGTDLFDSISYQSILQTGGSADRPLNRLLHHWKEAFFDLETDPYEKENLIDQPDLQPIIQDYR
ncbi:MAG: sulfatase family protein, partial [Puniceicoccales bacterium]